MIIRTPNSAVEDKLIVKKSVFFGYVLPMQKSTEYKEIVIHIKKKHKQARHIAFAYKIIKTNSKGKIEEEIRYSDDGEPSKTAGFPLLQIIRQKDLSNCIILVARIFGGIKLGIPGLIKAYSDTARLTLEKAEIVKKEITKEVDLQTSIQQFNKVETKLKQKNIEFDTSFKTTTVDIKARIPVEKEDLEEELRSLL